MSKGIFLFLKTVEIYKSCFGYFIIILSVIFDLASSNQLLSGKPQIYRAVCYNFF